jgi:hypothetical protein
VFGVKRERPDGSAANENPVEEASYDNLATTLKSAVP